MADPPAARLATLTTGVVVARMTLHHVQARKVPY
jgi:hypothetical protein